MRAPTAKQVADKISRLEKHIPEFANVPLTRELLGNMVRLLFGVMKGKDKPTPEMTSAAMRSLLPLENVVLNASMIKRNLQRVVANWQFVVDGTEIPMWDGNPVRTDVTFIGLVREHNSPERNVFLVKLKTGLCAGIISCALFYRTRLLTFLQHEAGVAKMACAPEELAGMTARATVSMLSDRVILSDMECTEADKKHNKELAEARRDVAKCSAAPMPCNVCLKDIKQCPLAIWLPEHKGETDVEVAHIEGQEAR